jgi:hypothetical protein
MPEKSGVAARCARSGVVKRTARKIGSNQRIQIPALCIAQMIAVSALKVLITVHLKYRFTFPVTALIRS